MPVAASGGNVFWKQVSNNGWFDSFLFFSFLTVYDGMFKTEKMFVVQSSHFRNLYLLFLCFSL